MRLHGAPSVALSTLIFLVACSGDAPKLKPGKYVVDLQVNQTIGIVMSGIRVTHCLREDDAKYGDPRVYKAVQDGTCSISNYHSSGRRISYEFNCSGESTKQWSRSVELTVSSESEFKTKETYGISGDMNTGDAKRVGEC